MTCYVRHAQYTSQVFLPQFQRISTSLDFSQLYKEITFLNTQGQSDKKLAITQKDMITLFMSRYTESKVVMTAVIPLTVLTVQGA